MINFTTDFKNAALADIRTPSALVKVAWGGSATDTGLVMVSNDVNRIDRKGQVTNGFQFSGYKWYYLHSGLTVNDAFRLCPETDGGPQMGWWGGALGDGSGVYTTNPKLTVSHDPRDYDAITVTADDRYGEYPVDFIIRIVHDSGTYTSTITGNSGRVYDETFSRLSNVTSIELEITKWSAPATVVKITQFTGLFEKQYLSDDIVTIDILEETNSDTGVVPIGNVSSNELDLSLVNSNRRFSYGNTSSQYANSLIANRKIRAWIGFKLPSGSTDATGDVPGYIVDNGYGYMPWGVYWSGDWISSYDSQETTTSAYDFVYRLSKAQYKKSLNFTGTVQSIVDSILTEAREIIPDLDWEVSSDTASQQLTNVVFQNSDYLTILKNLAVATSSYTYVNRSGTLIVGSLLGVSTPVAVEQQLGLSEYYTYVNTPKVAELVNTVRVGFTTYALGSTEEILYEDENEVFTIPASGELSLYLKWSSDAADASSVTVALVDTSGTISVGDFDAYATGGDITLTGTQGSTFRLRAEGYAYTLSENTETVATLPTSISVYGSRELEITGNQLITTEAQARALAGAILNYYGDLRQDGEISWNGSTLVAVGDTVEVTEFKSDTIETKDYFLINRQTLSYDGGLKSTLGLRRG